MIFKDIIIEGGKKDLDKFHIAIMMDDIEGQVEFVNNTFCKIFGYSKAEIKKLDNYALVHPDERDIVFKRHKDRISKNKDAPEEYELRGITKDGKEIYLWAFSLIRYDDNKNPIGTINYLWDISRYKRLEHSLTERENELIQSETELQGILESTADGILAVDKNGKVKMTNKRFAKLWNIPSDILASGDDDILLSHVIDQLVDPEEFLKKVTKLYSSTERDFDTLHFKDGRIFERYSRPLMIGQENVGRIWSFRDVTERISAEKALKDSEEKHRSLIENSPIIIMRLDKNGIISFINYNYAGKEPHELVGKKLYDFIPQDFTESAKETIDKVFKTRETLSFENIEMNTDDRVTWYRNNVSPEVVSGEVESVILISMDITELKQLDIMRNEFVASISHEIRTPLTILRESLSILESGIVGKLSTDQLDIVNPCIGEIDRLSKIINNLMDMTKMDTKNIKLEYDTVNIIDLAKSVLYSFQNKADNKGLALEFKSSARELQVYCDRDRMIQVFMNLIGNAVKFTNSGFVRVNINAEDNDILCSIADTGEGIEDEDLGTVFDSFHQVGKVIRAGEKGSGMGLTICKGIVKSHKGKIWVKSKLGIGSEFYFTLPNISTEDFILQNLGEALDEAKKALTKTSIMLMRIDNYDALVKEYGYDSVTKIRNKVFNRVENDIAFGDFIHRYGDNNFVLQSNLTKQNMIVTVSRIKTIMDEIFSQYGKDFSVDVSTGIAVYPDDGETAEGLWEKAKNELTLQNSK